MIIIHFYNEIHSWLDSCRQEIKVLIEWFIQMIGEFFQL